MLVLDTDHLVEYQKGTSAEALSLKERLDRASEPYATTIVTVEEIMRGWMAAVRRIADPLNRNVETATMKSDESRKNKPNLLPTFVASAIAPALSDAKRSQDCVAWTQPHVRRTHM